MTKVVVNACYGGFGLSHEAILRYGELANLNLLYEKGKHNWDSSYYKNGVISDENYFSITELNREDPILVQVVEELGTLANDRYSELRIADVPDDIEWYIDDYDGIETVREIHRTW
jgi:hypothetical protein